MRKLRITALVSLDLILLFVPNFMTKWFVIPITTSLSFFGNRDVTGLLFLLLILFIRSSLSSAQWFATKKRANYDTNVEMIKSTMSDTKRLPELIQANNLVKPKTYYAEIMILQIGLVFIIYAIARRIDASLLGIPYNHPIGWLSFIIGLGYWLYYKYFQKDVSHFNRWTTPAIMFFISSVANLSIQIYMLISIIALLLVEYVPMKNDFKQTKFEKDLPDVAQENTERSLLSFLSFMSKEQGALFIKSIMTTLSIYYLLEILASIGGSIVSGSAIPQITFIVGIIAFDYILPDKKYTWFK